MLPSVSSMLSEIRAARPELTERDVKLKLYPPCKNGDRRVDVRTKAGELVVATIRDKTGKTRVAYRPITREMT